MAAIWQTTFSNAPSVRGLQKMVGICEEFANAYSDSIQVKHYACV